MTKPVPCQTLDIESSLNSGRREVTRRSRRRPPRRMQTCLTATMPCWPIMVQPAPRCRGQGFALNFEPHLPALPIIKALAKPYPTAHQLSSHNGTCHSPPRWPRGGLTCLKAAQTCYAEATRLRYCGLTRHQRAVVTSLASPSDPRIEIEARTITLDDIRNPRHGLQ